MSAYILPAILLLLLVYCAAKKVGVYDCFTEGVKEALKLIYSIFPYIAAIFILIQLFKVSGISGYVTRALAVPLSFLGIPPELAELLILRPLSGGGTLAILEGIFNEYGADSYVSKCAAVVMGSTETILYIAAIYFSSTKIRKLRGAIGISLIASLAGAIVACALCRFI